MGIYGPRTVYVIALKDAPGCHEFLLQDDGKWLHVKETTEIGELPTPYHDWYATFDCTCETPYGSMLFAYACAGSPSECIECAVNMPGMQGVGVWPWNAGLLRLRWIL